jgi:hypothetical protein
MAGLVPAIHVLLPEEKTWMPGTRPGMTMERQYTNKLANAPRQVAQPNL